MTIGFCPDCNNPTPPYAHERFIGGGGFEIFRCKKCGCKFAIGSETGKWVTRTYLHFFKREVFIPCEIKSKDFIRIGEF